MFKGISHLLIRAIMQTFVEPKRARRYDARTEPFLYATPSGTIFELWPNECVDRVIAVEGMFERRFVKYLQSILPRDTVMLDIGANIGNHAISLAKVCRLVHCFEPNPKVAARLRRNITYNGLDNQIFVHEYGLGLRDEIMTFVENSEGNLGASKFLRRGEDREQSHLSLKLQVKRADCAVEALKLDRLDFIKVDVEGMEEQVLTSLKPTIALYRPIVAFEHHEQLVEPGTFSRIQEVFTGYRLMEPCFAPIGTAKEKFIWNLKNDGGPVLSEVRKPEHRSYDTILAIPNPR